MGECLYYPQSIHINSHSSSKNHGFFSLKPLQGKAFSLVEKIKEFPFVLKVGKCVILCEIMVIIHRYTHK